jgi:hypothetical protein
MDEKLRNLRKAISECEGTPIPYNIIKGSIEPLIGWLDETKRQEDKE